MPEHVHNVLMINNDVECRIAMVEGNSRNRDHDHIKCHESVGKGRIQLTRCAAERNSLTSARGRIEVDIQKKTLDASSGQNLGMDTALKKCWQAVESDIDETKRRIGEIQE